ncbi:MAG: MotA/TolQ/ExbB proton channel family protein [Bacteroidetes bacterium]|nr:MAG: MotA/TolQ/ExbB proton channel family protein [Bacteroidota bacterium]
MFFLLQTVSDSTTVTTGASQSLLDTLIAGGWPMIILAFLLVLAIYIAIERYLTIRKANADSEEFMKQVRKYVLAGNIEAAKGLCESTNDPFARMIHKGITRLGSASLKDIEASIENVGKLEVYRMERRLSLLATVAGAAPMVGFLGTVLGMIQAFNAIVQGGGNVNPTQLADGISQAMITTASGLVVGILAYLAYNTLVAMVNKVVFKLELTSTDFIDLLQEPASA